MRLLAGLVVLIAGIAIVVIDASVVARVIVLFLTAAIAAWTMSDPKKS